MKRLVRNFVRRFGFDIVRYRPGVTPTDLRRSAWLRDLGVTVVIDVGANTGQFVEQVRAAGYGGRVVSFEPVSAAFVELERKAAADPRWECRRLGLGPAPADVDINVAGNNAESSSLLPMGERHLAAAPESAYVRTERICIVPLDSLRADLLRPGDVAWLK